MTASDVRAGTWAPCGPPFSSYEASDRGQVRSVDRIDSIGRRRKGEIMAPRLSANGYVRVNTTDDDGVKRTMSVHVLVLLAHVGERPADKPITRHLNDDKTDNRWPENICYGTRPENEADKERARIAAERDASATAWLETYLREAGGTAFGSDLLPAAEAAGFPPGVIYRVRQLLGVTSVQVSVWGYGDALSSVTERDVQFGTRETEVTNEATPALSRFAAVASRLRTRWDT
jgi:hypothetical protein